MLKIAEDGIIKCVEERVVLDMLLSINTSFVPEQYGIDRTIEMIADVGFDAADISLSVLMQNEDSEFNGDDYINSAKRIRKLADSEGIIINQAHAPCPTSFYDDEKTKAAFDSVVRSMEIAAIMGAKCTVVHPIHHLDYLKDNNAEILKDMNMEFYDRLLPYCKEYGIKIAIENMWQYDDNCRHIVSSTCANTEEFKEYVDAQDSEWFTACLDVGHCGLAGVDARDAIRALGGKRITALHIHDNDYKDDHHVLPFTSIVGKMNWEGICKALADIDYSGDFTFEVRNNIFGKLGEKEAISSLRNAYDVGTYLISRIEHFKTNK